MRESGENVAAAAAAPAAAAAAAAAGDAYNGRMHRGALSNETPALSATVLPERRSNISCATPRTSIYVFSREFSE